jgi:aryl-alcohol dehydrogenase-like predicted oxidoreductase
MKTRKFGKLGWDVSDLGFGAWAIGGSWGQTKEDESLAALNRALDLGMNFIDTAAGYGGGKSERLIGQVLKARGVKLGSGKVRVATKTPPNWETGSWPPHPYESAESRYSAKYLRENVEERLRMLGSETVDLLQLHTWTRAWNKDPQPLLELQKLKKEGKILAIGMSTPEHDQNALIDLMRAGLLDSVQVIYNIFEQEPVAEFLPVAQEHGVAVIVRVALDESSLTGKFTKDTKFGEDDFRSKFFRGDRLTDTIKRVEAVQKTIAEVGTATEKDLISVALRFALNHPAVSTVIPGMRNVAQVESNCAVSDQPPLSDKLMAELKKHNWRRMFWYE